MNRLCAFLIVVAIVGTGGTLLAQKKKFAPEGVSENEKSEKTAETPKEKKAKTPQKKKAAKKGSPPQDAAAEPTPALVPVPAAQPAEKPAPPPPAAEKTAVKPVEKPVEKPAPPPVAAVPAEVPAPPPPAAQPAEKGAVTSSETALLLGRVIDADTKKPLMGAKVTTNAFPYPAQSAKDGSFSYPLRLKPALYTMEVESPGYKKFSTQLHIPPRTKEFPVTISLALDSSTLRSMAEHPDGSPFEPAGKRGAEKVMDTTGTVAPDTAAGPAIIVVSGVLKNAVTGEPVSGSLMLKEQNLQVPVDAEGKFVLSLQPGEYTIAIPIVGFIPEEKKITVTGNSAVTWELTPVERTRQWRHYHDHIATTPAVVDMPGVAITAPRHRSDNGFLIAGAAAAENAFYIEGFQSPFTHHPLSRDTVIHPALIGTAELSYGGFSPEYSDATGGMVALTLRDPRTDRVGGMFDISLFGVSVLAEGPLSANSAFAAAVSKGLTDLFPRFFYGPKAALVYNDHFDTTLLYRHNFSPAHSLRVYAFGGMDNIGIRAEHLENGVPERTTALSPAQFFARITAEYLFKFQELDEKIENRIALSYENRNLNYALYDTSDTTLTAHLVEGIEKISWTVDQHHRLTVGGAMRLGFFRYATDYTLLPIEGESMTRRVPDKIDDPGYQPYLHPSLFVQHAFTYAGFTVEPGLVLYGDFHNKKHYDLSLDPRLMLRYAFDETMAITLSGGLYSRRPDYDIASGTWGTEELLPEHAIHAVLGFEKTFLNAYTVGVKGFYRYLYNLTRRSGIDPLEYTNIGEGYAAGGVILFRANIADTFTGTVGYSFSISQRKDSPAADYRSSEADIPHAVSLTARYTPTREWAIQTRFSLRSGDPYSRYSGAELIDDGVQSRFEPIPLFDATGRPLINDRRHGLVHELDLRGEYTLFLDEMLLTLFAEMRGISGLVDKNAVGFIYAVDLSDRIDLSTTPFTATIGIRGEF